MELLTNILTLWASLVRIYNSELDAPPYNKAFSVVMFNATLPARDFVVPGEDFYKNVSI